MRDDVYQACKGAAAKLSDQSEESQRFVRRVLRDFERNGLSLPVESRDRIKEIQTRISELGITFARNLGEETTLLDFEETELEGMPKEFFEKLNKSVRCRRNR